jgi:hypothetical protein
VKNTTVLLDNRTSCQNKAKSGIYLFRFLISVLSGLELISGGNLFIKKLENFRKQV